MDTRTSAQSALDPLAVPADRLYRLRPEVYEGMLEHGLLKEGDGVELVDGLLVKASSNGSAPAPFDRLYRISLDLYHGMVRHGLLTKYDKVELLDGLLVKKMTKGDPHTAATILVGDALRDLGLEGWHVRNEAPVALPGGPRGRDSEPEPDVSLARGAARDYLTHRPGPGDTGLVIEVADSSLRADQAKMQLYARAGIPAAWLVDLTNRVVKVFANPTRRAATAKYRTVKVYHPGDLVPVVIDGQEVGQVAVNDILP